MLIRFMWSSTVARETSSRSPAMLVIVLFAIPESIVRTQCMASSMSLAVAAVGPSGFVYSRFITACLCRSFASPTKSPPSPPFVKLYPFSVMRDLWFFMYLFSYSSASILL
ncbi:hypothetical protein NY2A_b500R [Paramecium bursaria Chlorella virus NY2A]|uniref:Uncharacterized protein b500R n=1 Tax=Paramecium bursaria Chlorella virus NY2A TaxID=46021 RepID=A7IX25_PBCVN|nr:hypothetical protein NY2A_b500R [Paramecium bursaria Chlorella virus NY2A]YP_001498522.1 hypothetical protein AR158_c441R [Paramecium bursaria Chlorella virus AR158]ABT14899.1 hypothetical protein NY2A_b500R [Paramecium bursaria Chlorella virus NY2A]ABU43986.1 hypothetical protein AR158_c441R [Paramecium bursaria Chlorella virus AR158]